MPLKPAEILSALIDKDAEFKDFSQTTAATLQHYRHALAQVSQQASGAMATALADAVSPGARPLEPWEQCPHWVLPFPVQWRNREQSLAWVREQLAGVTTFAVDGSQIYPSQELSVPVALVQVGWFENPHSPLGTYDKDVRLEVLSPIDLQTPIPTRPVDRQVSMHRFRLEIERLMEFMVAHPHRSDCLVLFDGSLVASFAERFDPDCRAFYVDQLVTLLRTSEQQRVPLVAYVDTSSARDLVQSLQQWQHLPEIPSLCDAALVGVQMQWGDRTPLFLCDRPGEGSNRGVLQAYHDQAQSVAFTYLKTNESPPVRLELPVWIYEAGLLEEVLDRVRGEVIVGGGYPYAIETADQIAVLRTEDRQIFLRLLQDWAEQQSLTLHFSRKTISKEMRRGYSS